MATLIERPLLHRDRKHMVISWEDLKSVCFISADTKTKSGLRHEVIGTAFFLRISSGLYGQVFYYAVTATHVLHRFGRPPMSFVFPRGTANDSEPFDITSFRELPGSDVSIAPVPADSLMRMNDDIHAFDIDRLSDTAIDSGLSSYSLGFFIDPEDHKHIYRPFARFGHISLPNVVSEKFGHVHLLDSLAWSGDSGAPVFAHYQQYSQTVYSSDSTFGNPGIPHVLSAGGFPLRHSSSEVKTELIGLIHGYHEMPDSVTFPNRRGKNVKGGSGNAGVAIVIRAAEIKLCLQSIREQE